MKMLALVWVVLVGVGGCAGAHVDAASEKGAAANADQAGGGASTSDGAASPSGGAGSEGKSAFGAAAGCASATTYYVDPAGLDSNTATTTTAAWATIAAVNAHVYCPGDSILFKAGATFDGQIVLGESSFAVYDESKPLHVSSYGSGVATLSPSGGTDKAPVTAIHSTVGGIEISHLLVDGKGTVGDGISFVNTLGAGRKRTNVKITDVEVTRFAATASGVGSGADYGNMGHGIYFGGGDFASSSASTNGFTDVTIANVRAHHNGGNGITFYQPGGPNAGSSTTSPSYAHARVTISQVVASYNTGTTAKTNLGYGLLLGGVDGAKVERSVFAWNGSMDNGSVGAIAWIANNVVFEHNEAHHNMTGGKDDGDGFDFDVAVTNSVVQYNYTHDNDGAGVLNVSYAPWAFTSGNVVRFNVSQNDGRKNSYSGIEAVGNVSRTEIYNNTIFIDSRVTSALAAFYVAGWLGTDLHVRNNVLVTSGSGNYPVVKTAGGNGYWNGLRLQGNVYWSSGAAFATFWDGHGIVDFDGWRSYSGMEYRTEWDPCGHFADPGLAAAGQGPTLDDAAKLENLSAYRAVSGGAARTSGLDLEREYGVGLGGQDFFGTPLSGAIERRFVGASY